MQKWNLSAQSCFPPFFFIFWQFNVDRKWFGNASVVGNFYHTFCLYSSVIMCKEKSFQCGWQCEVGVQKVCLFEDLISIIAHDHVKMLLYTDEPVLCEMEHGCGIDKKSSHICFRVQCKVWGSISQACIISVEAGVCFWTKNRYTKIWVNLLSTWEHAELLGSFLKSALIAGYHFSAVTADFLVWVSTWFSCLALAGPHLETCLLSPQSTDEEQ